MKEKIGELDLPEILNSALQKTQLREWKGEPQSVENIFKTHNW